MLHLFCIPLVFMSQVRISHSCLVPLVIVTQVRMLHACPASLVIMSQSRHNLIITVQLCFMLVHINMPSGLPFMYCRFLSRTSLLQTAVS